MIRVSNFVKNHFSHGRPKLNFQFTVSDGEHTLTPENFTIKLSSHDTAPPSFITKNPSLEVELDGTVTIGRYTDVVVDKFNPSVLKSLILIILTLKPRFAVINWVSLCVWHSTKFVFYTSRRRLDVGCS